MITKLVDRNERRIDLIYEKYIGNFFLLRFAKQFKIFTTSRRLLLVKFLPTTNKRNSTYCNEDT